MQPQQLQYALGVRELAGLVGNSDHAEPCPELAQALTAYVGAEIDQATCVQIEKHLATCAQCAGACDALKRTVSLCRRLPGDVVPAPVRTAVREAIMAAIAVDR